MKELEILKRFTMIVIAIVTLCLPLALQGCGGGSATRSQTTTFVSRTYRGALTLQEGTSASVQVVTSSDTTATGSVFVTVDRGAPHVESPGQPHVFQFLYPLIGTYNPRSGSFQLATDYDSLVYIPGTLDGVDLSKPSSPPFLLSGKLPGSNGNGSATFTYNNQTYTSPLKR